MVRPVNSMILGPLLNFFCCEASSFMRSNTVWNNMIVDKAFYTSKDGSFGRSIACRDGKSLSRISPFQ